MTITELKIDSFAGLHNRNITLSNGINIISGKNESGKSSLCDFVRFILFGITDGESKSRHVSLYTGKASGSMTLSLGREELSADKSLPEKILIEREYIPGQTDAVRISDAITGAVISTDHSPGEFLLGISSTVYDSTAYVSQLGGRGVNGQKLSEAVKNILHSADESVDITAALCALDDNGAVLSGEDGEIASLITARDALQAKLDTIEANAAECKKLEAELITYEKRIQDNAVKLKEAEQRVRHYEEALSLAAGNKNSDAALKKRNALLERRQQIRENASYEGFLPNDAYIERISFLRDTIGEERDLLLRMNQNETLRGASEITPEKAKQISAIEANGGSREIEHRAEDSNTKKKAYLILAFILFAIFAVSVCVGLVLLRDGEKRGVLPILIGLTALAGTVITIISRRQAVAEYYNVMNLVGAYDLTDLYRILDTYERDSRHNGGLYDEIHSVKDCTDSINEMETELTELLSYWNMESVEEALGCYSRFNIRLGEIDAEIEQQNALLEASETEDDDQRRERLYGMLGESQHAQSVPSDASEISSALETVRREYGFFRGASDALLQKKHEIELRATECRTKAASPAPVRERLSEVEAILERKKRRATALSLASKTLRKAADSLKDELAPALAERTGEICREISDGRYPNAKVCQDISITLSEHSGINSATLVEKGMQFLSGGTRDMAYIALRVALIEQLCRERLPAIIFDESFCHMDDERIRRTVSVLYREASLRGIQMIILSSQEREARLISELGLGYNHIEM